MGILDSEFTSARRTLALPADSILTNVVQAENKINVHPYEEIFHRTKLLASGSNGTSPVERVKQIRKKWLISDKASWALQLALGGDSKVGKYKGEDFT